YITVLFTKFDLCIDFYNNKNSMFITFLSFANKKMGFFKKKLLNKIVYNQTVKPEELSYKIYNLAEGIMKKLKLNCGTLKPELYFSNENLSDADKFFFNKTKFQIGIFVGASIESRRWDLENVKRLIFGLKDKNIQFYILSGPLENESVKQECLKISEEVPYYFDMNILELSSFISKLDLLVTNDSGPLHIAKAVNTDFIGLFGPTHHEVAVIGENSAYLSGYTKCNVLKRIENDRNPCEYKNCESKECIKSITPEQVSEKVMEYYNKKYSSE
ncbi:glycosyltransferase family 9 protein, partial [Candidatus Dependentiae bacterium]|nr:glycosyltransferase family 9 protein [Candidatus Dependentiae bacterium]